MTWPDAAIAFGGLGLFNLIFAWLCATHRLPPNPFVGIRLSRTMESREVWDSAHAAAAPWCALSAVGLLLYAAGLAVFRPPASAGLSATGVILVLVPLVPAVVSTVRAAGSSEPE